MKKDNHHTTPPQKAERLLEWFLKPELAEEVTGDLEEKFYITLQKHSKSRAKRNYWYQVFNYMRPFALGFFRSKTNNITMIKHNFKISLRHMLREKSHTFINVGGLAIGMVVTMLIGLWVYDELSYNKVHSNYDNIAQVLRQSSNGKEHFTSSFLTTGMGALIRETYPDQVERVVMVRGRRQNRVLANEDLKFRQEGIFLEAGGPEMLSLDMKYGVQNGLEDAQSVMLSETLATKLFGDENPVGELVKLDASTDLKVTGVYRDLPKNSRFANATYFSRLVVLFGGNQELLNIWNNYNVYVYVQLHPEAKLEDLSPAINQLILDRLGDDQSGRRTSFLLHPMKDWHLNSEWEKGELVTSRAMKFVWLYGIIGAFVLVLACINFMNLSTARSEKRAKEVGIRKTLGSVRGQLIFQFYIESLLYSLIAFGFSLLLLWALLPWFNDTAGKDIALPWSLNEFWVASGAVVLLTAILAGSYPAVFLSRFKPVRALKGALSQGKGALLPRKILVVFQFTISIALIAGTITVNNLIQSARDRSVGYSPEGMLSVRPASPNFGDKYKAMKGELLRTGMVAAIGTSNYSVTSTLGWNGGFSWDGMDPQFSESFNTIYISPGYAEAVSLDFIHGRPFSEESGADKNGIIINRSAMESMQLENPVGTVVNWAPGFQEPTNYTIVGVVEDMIKGSPFQQTDQSVMFNDRGFNSWLYIRLNPEVSANQAIPEVQKVFNAFLPEAPFDFHFADDDYDKKFDAEVRIGKLAGFFSGLAIFISCLGLFGLAAYVAEQRTKEIGIRKVLGASVSNLWALLSRDFALLVTIACFISIPIAYYVLDGWLATYDVGTELSWWIFALAGTGALIITVITVSFQAIKAAVANPVRSLRTE